LPNITNGISHAQEEALSDTVDLFGEKTSTTIFKNISLVAISWVLSEIKRKKNRL